MAIILIIALLVGAGASLVAISVMKHVLGGTMRRPLLIGGLLLFACGIALLVLLV
ncbi:hypothetical protein GCM10007989_05430 [Devosia pacifica]|uniref:Uncharacterized protein n=1 Tax=Devosia pacifica TaxID=1335967 RepID=A0A918VP23_9HYPH|nr:hypothetical protein [Devosia pacifica]GHA13735.1 hypothetical protein GCM10007989_05430 [Devosia pacifica]